MRNPSKILVVQVAALGHGLTCEFADMATGFPLQFRPLQTTFPAVTCTAQATFRTAAWPHRHGMVCNGLYDRERRKVEFWNQSTFLLSPERIWNGFRQAGRTVGMMFWQQSMGETVDLLLSPAPVHKHRGGIIQDCYSQPPELYVSLCRGLGRSFNLRHYWGPLASRKATRWITGATVEVMASVAPDLLLTYLPHLDYTLQKNGPADVYPCRRAFAELVEQLIVLHHAASENGYRILVWGDYAITPAKRVVFPNRRLREAGFFAVRRIEGMTYPDLHASRAFAMVDHQTAHVFVQGDGDLGTVRRCLENTPGIDRVADRSEAMDHPNAGDLILTADRGAWFAYPWWTDKREAPDYAAHVDIHNKIGFDPCELLLGRLLPPQISLDPSRVMGTHGRNDEPVAYATDLALPETPETVVALSRGLQDVLEH